MFGNLGNIANLMKSAKELQENMARMKAELAKRRFEAETGGGLVKAVVDGQCTLVDIRIDAEATKDTELLEDLIKAAVGSAMAKAQESARQEMAALTGGMNIPGLSDMLK